MIRCDQANQDYDDATRYSIMGLPFFLNWNLLFDMATENELVSMCICARVGQHTDTQMDKCAHFECLKWGAGLVGYSG